MRLDDGAKRANLAGVMLLRFLPKAIYAFFCCIYLFTVGWLKTSHRFLIYQICLHFGWDRERMAYRLRKVPAGELLSNPLEICFCDPVPVDANVSMLELAVLIETARRRGARQVFEIGTFDGRTARNLARCTGAEGHVYTLDLPPDMLQETAFELYRGEEMMVKKERSGGRFAGTPEEGRITQLLGDSGKFDFTPWHGKIDFVFIDGSHAYEYVLSDSRHALKMIGPGGGVIFWHDYSPAWADVMHALNELLRTNAAYKNLVYVEGTTLAMLDVPAQFSPEITPVVITPHA